MSSETRISHGSDWIQWVEGTGTENSSVAVSAERLQVRLTQAPADLRVLSKARGSLLRRPVVPGMEALVQGTPTAEDLTRPAFTPYLVRGEVWDPEGVYLPRAFQVSAGGGSGHTLPLFRSPQGTRLGQGGAVVGETCFEDGRVAPWVLLKVVIDLTPFQAITCLAQSDARGAFLMPLTRLMPRPKGSPSPSWPARLTVKADPAATPATPADPSALVDMNLGILAADLPAFGSALDFAVTPDTLNAVHSPQFPPPTARIVLKPRP